jgi:S-adenosylmethionine hydrolase
MKRPILTLLTDFGTRDPFVGILKGVILGICPEAQLVDLSHEVPPQAISTGAFVLKSVLEYFPKGTVHLAVVDPGVGSARKAIALRSKGHYFVGPDNGLFPAALKEWGIEEIYELTDKKYQLTQISSTFHGRDLFAPAAAHLAAGLPLGRLGKKLSNLIWREIPTPFKTPAGWTGEVLWVDRYGNLITNLTQKHLGDTRRPLSAGSGRFRLKIGKTILLNIATHYAQAKEGTVMALISSTGHLEIAVNRGRADEKLKAGIGSPVLIPF